MTNQRLRAYGETKRHPKMRSNPRRGLLDRVEAAKAAKDESTSNVKPDRHTPTKPKVEPNIKRKSSSSQIGGDASTPQKRASGQIKGKSDRDEDEEEVFDCLFDDDGDCELVEDDAEAERKVCLGCFRVTNLDEHHLVPGAAMPWLYDKSRGNFCKDCCGAYRVLFKGTMGLALFARWLKANRHTFLCKHIT
jgi:hypothetical protein